MSWRQIILKNALGNSRRYIGYIASCAVAVMVFFMFASFIYNPAVEHSHMTSIARGILMGCQYIIIAFAIFFIFFFHSALLRLRGREFGLFLVLGTRPRQIGRMVFIESILLAAVSIVVGMAAGASLTKLFLMALGSLLHLQSAIPFQIPMRVEYMTLILFGVVFLVEALFTSWRIRRRTPKALILGQREQQKPPKFSWWLVLLSLACLAFAYYLALAFSAAIVTTMFPILILTTIGTYFLYSQVFVMVLSKMRKRSLSGSGLLVVGRLAHRIRDNARVLTVVTMLAAVVMTSMGSVLGLQYGLQVMSTQGDPYTMMVAEQKGHTLPVSAPKVRKMFEDHHFSVKQQTDVPVLELPFQSAQSKHKESVYVMSASTFGRAENVLRKAKPELKKYLPAIKSPRPGHAYLQVSPAMRSGSLGHTNSGKVFLQGLGTKRVVVDGTAKATVLNDLITGPVYTLIVSDQDYAHWSLLVPDSGHWTMHGFLVSHWQQSQPVVDEIYSQVPKKVQHSHYESPVPTYMQVEQLLSTTIFAGFFVSVLFFLACGSSLYFRLQSQFEEDRRQFSSLRRIGLQRQEAAHVLTREFLLMFGAPVLFGVAHSVVAMLDFTHLLQSKVNIWPVFGIVVGVFVLAMAVYFLISRFNHLRNVLPGSSKSR